MMDNDELKTLFAHALLTGLATNGHLLTANVSGEEIGKMVREKTNSIVAGFTEEEESEDDAE